jgi:hypothetical protein
MMIACCLVAISLIVSSNFRRINRGVMLKG